MYQVVEQFVSINGEGVCAGELAAFIRFKGCNLSCSYCDTRWANLKDAFCAAVSADDLFAWAKKTGVRNITLTGGEPLLQENIGELISQLGKNGFRVEIETNGSVSIENLAKSEYRPVFTMDYKLPESGMEQAMDCGNFEYLIYDDTVKFVVGSRNDLLRALEVMEQYQLRERCHVYLSPVFGKIDPADMVKFMKKNQLNGVRLQLQLHKFIWNPEKRGV